MSLRLPIRLQGAATPSGLITQSDITYLGCMRTTNFNFTDQAYGGLAARWVTVGGTPELHFFLCTTHGPGSSATLATIVSGASTTVFTVQTGYGSQWSAGSKINVVRAANGTNLPEHRLVQSVSTDTITVTVALGGTPANGDTAYTDSDQVVELVDTGTGTYTTDYTMAPVCDVYCFWGDIYNGHRVTWDVGVLQAPIPAAYPTAMFWHEGHQLLYWTYNNAYNVNGYPDWGLGACSLDSITPSSPIDLGTTTSYGPWRTVTTDGDGSQFYGPASLSYIGMNPDGTLMGGSSPGAGNIGFPWGPTMYAGVAFPGTSTPCCLGQPDITVPDRYLNYYYMGPGGPTSNYFNPDGSVHGVLRSFPRDFYQAVYEPSQSTVVRANPALNGGIGSWAENDNAGAIFWLDLGTKKGVIYTAKLAGALSQDSTDCTLGVVGHEWYANPGNVPPYTCDHGCDAPVTVTGPVTRAAFTGLFVFDPDDLTAVKNGSKTDYTVLPTSSINLDVTYGIKTADLLTIGVGKTAYGGYWDDTRNYLFLVSQQGDSTSNPGANTALIHVFHISG